MPINQIGRGFMIRTGVPFSQSHQVVRLFQSNSIDLSIQDKLTLYTPQQPVPTFWSLTWSFLSTKSWVGLGAVGACRCEEPSVPEEGSEDCVSHYCKYNLHYINRDLIYEIPHVREAPHRSSWLWWSKSHVGALYFMNKLSEYHLGLSIFPTVISEERAHSYEWAPINALLVALVA